MKTEYTPAELVELLKQKQGTLTLAAYANEIGISMQMLSQILLGDGTMANGRRSVGNEKVLEYLAPPGREFVRVDRYFVVAKRKS